MLAAVVGVVARAGEIERFIELARRVEPAWLASCLALQSATYMCEAAAWKIVLRRLGYPFTVRRLLPLSVAKLFSDQAVPSAGLSGNAFFLAALRRRGVATTPALSCVLAETAAHFAAYASMTAAALLLPAMHGGVRRWLVAPAAAVVALQAAIPLALWYLKRHGRLPGAGLLERHPRLRARTATLRHAAQGLPSEPATFLRLVALHAGIILLDAASLWTVLRALGVHAAFGPVCASFVAASVVMSLSPVPLGLGTFEATCVAMLGGAGIGLEAALTATILLRGTTTWLPMLPGLWLIRREMRGLRQAPGRQSTMRG
jgi:uncharacterized protein (TIRG00374 family)